MVGGFRVETKEERAEVGVERMQERHDGMATVALLH
jgi:hypothetical protein